MTAGETPRFNMDSALLASREAVEKNGIYIRQHHQAADEDRSEEDRVETKEQRSYHITQ